MFGQRAGMAIEHPILGTLVDQLVVAFVQQAAGAEPFLGIDLTLHDVVFSVDRRQPALGLHEDQPVHAVGDVKRHGCHRTVIDIKTGVEAL